MGQTRGSRVVTSVGQAVKCGYLSVLLLALALASGKVTAAKEFLEAGPQWSPQEVVAIQLDACRAMTSPPLMRASSRSGSLRTLETAQ